MWEQANAFEYSKVTSIQWIALNDCQKSVWLAARQTKQLNCGILQLASVFKRLEDIKLEYIVWKFFHPAWYWAAPKTKQ